MGIGGLFPGSSTLDQFWANICNGVDATTDVPPGRWLIDPAQAFDPRVAAGRSRLLRRGGFVDLAGLDLKGLKLDGIRRIDWTRSFSLHSTRRGKPGAMPGPSRSKAGEPASSLATSYCPPRRSRPGRVEVLLTAFEGAVRTRGGGPRPGRATGTRFRPVCRRRWSLGRSGSRGPHTRSTPPAPRRFMRSSWLRQSFGPAGPTP